MEPATDEIPLPKDVPAKHVKKELPEVITVRNWKEYVGESLLIIFSVALALGLTEYFTNLHEKQQAKEILHQLKEELIRNKENEDTQYAYHLQVLQTIDSALHNPSFAAKVVDSGAFHWKLIVPDGVLRKDLNDVIWQIAKQNNIFSRIDIGTYSLLTEIYSAQQRITNSEDKIGSLLLSWESRKPENIHTTLILLRDNYKGWAVDRAPGLLRLYQRAIDNLEEY